MKKITLLIFCIIMLFSVSSAAEFTIIDGVLLKCTGMDANITIPEGVVSIGDINNKEEGNIFVNTKIRNIVLPKSLKYIGDSSFKKCNNLEKITINSHIEEIGENAFEGCTNLKNIDISTVKSIGSSAFLNCNSLSNIKISASTIKKSEKNESNIFEGCNIKNIEIIGDAISDSRNGEFWEDVLNTTWARNQNIIFLNNTLYKYVTSASEVTIPGNVRVLAHNALNECSNMRYLTIPKNVEKIYQDSSKLINCSTKVIRDSVAYQYVVSNNLTHVVDGESMVSKTGMHNFTKRKSYSSDLFTDVSADAWYNDFVKKCYELDLINGKPNNYYGAQDNIRISEVITLAARINSIYNRKDINLTVLSGEKWYMPYVKYAKENGIVCDFDYYERPALRKEMVQIIKSCLPESEWTKINNVTAIPDVNHTDNISKEQKEAIFSMFNAGILSGNNEYGIFYPGLPVIRAEVSAMVSKIIDKSLRTKINLQPSDMVIVNGKSEKNTVEIDMTKDMPTTLTINDIIAMNNQKTFYEYKENGELAYLSGKFSNQKIENAGQAVEAVNILRDMLRVNDARKQFVFDNMEDSTNYKLQEVKDGEIVPNSYLILGVDKRDYPVFLLNKTI